MFKKRKIAIGLFIRRRIGHYPTFRKRPKKKMDFWIECPDFEIKKMKRITREDEEVDRAYSITIHADSSAKMREMLDYMIAVGKEEITEDNMKIWLHAVKHSTIHSAGLYSCVLTYIFRIKAIPEEDEENI